MEAALDHAVSEVGGNAGLARLGTGREVPGRTQRVASRHPRDGALVVDTGYFHDGIGFDNMVLGRWAGGASVWEVGNSDIPSDARGKDDIKAVIKAARHIDIVYIDFNGDFSGFLWFLLFEQVEKFLACLFPGSCE